MKKLVSRLALIAMAATLFGLAGSSPANAGSYVFQATCLSGGVISEPMLATTSSPNTYHSEGGQCPGSGGLEFSPYVGWFTGDNWTPDLSLGQKASVGYDLGTGAKFVEVRDLSYQNQASTNISSSIRIEGGSLNYPLAAAAPGFPASGTVTNHPIPALGQGPRLKSTLSCDSTICGLGERSRATIKRHPRLVIEDYTPPVAAWYGGTLLSHTYVYGVRTLETVAVDSNSGVAQVKGLVNGQTIFTSNNSCSTTKLRPCGSPYLPPTATVNTAQPPFVEGYNELKICATDFAQTGTANTYCSDPRVVLVDN